VRAQFGLDSGQCVEATRAGNEMRERLAFEWARPRWLPGERN
jgi:hypothetical protein